MKNSKEEEEVHVTVPAAPTIAIMQKEDLTEDGSSHSTQQAGKVRGLRVAATALLFVCIIALVVIVVFIVNAQQPEHGAGKGAAVLGYAADEPSAQTSPVVYVVAAIVVVVIFFLCACLTRPDDECGCGACGACAACGIDCGGGC